MENMFLLVRVNLRHGGMSTTPIAVSEDIGNLHAYTPGWEWHINAADVWVTNNIGDVFYRIDTVVHVKEI